MRGQASRLTDKFKDRIGDTTITNFDLDLLVDVNVLAYTPKKKFLGATYTASVAIPIANAAVTIPRLGDGARTYSLEQRMNDCFDQRFRRTRRKSRIDQLEDSSAVNNSLPAANCANEYR